MSNYIYDKLQLKMERDYSNYSNNTKILVVDSLIGTTNGYIVWSNGYCEQWGRSNVRTYKDTQDIKLLKPFKNTNYTLIGASPYEQSAGGKGSSWALKVASEDTITYRSGFEQDLDSRWVFWLASGYINI